MALFVLLKPTSCENPGDGFSSPGANKDQTSVDLEAVLPDTVGDAVLSCGPNESDFSLRCEEKSSTNRTLEKREHCSQAHLLKAKQRTAISLESNEDKAL